MEVVFGQLDDMLRELKAKEEIRERLAESGFAVRAGYFKACSRTQ